MKLLKVTSKNKISARKKCARPLEQLVGLLLRDVDMNKKLMFSSNTDLWSTPQDFFDNLNKDFYFSTDVCALPENAKCENYFTPEIDGLRQEWTGVCWMNPPYGRKISAWVKKAYDSSVKNQATVVCLLPARTDTAWWHDYCIKGDIKFIRGRLKFAGHKNSAPFPSAVVVFRPKSICPTVI